MTVKIFLVDDHKVLLDGLRALLEQHADLKVIGEAGDGRTAVRKVLKLKPDLVIMDIRLPELNGIEATRQILTQDPSIKILALSMHTNKRFVSEMLKSGVLGYLQKGCDIDELIKAIRQVLEGNIYLSPSITGEVVKDYVSFLSSDETSVFSILTDREREVLQCLSEGRAVKEIALQLHVSVTTIETHRRRIMKKLNIHTVAELTKYAVREGLTSLDP
jgi:DNA-binding NarL/FixJ family response regulator